MISDELADLIDRGDPFALVELARGARHGPVDVTYQRALELIDPGVWAHSIVFRLTANFATQLDRNRQRGTTTPEPVMRQLYQADDPESFVNAGIPVTDLTGSSTDANLARLLPKILRPSKTPHVGDQRVGGHNIVVSR